MEHDTKSLCINATVQQAFLEAIRRDIVGPLFLPQQDRCSKQAQRNALKQWLYPDSVLGEWVLVLIFLVLKIPLTPAVWLFIRWRSARPQAGWEIDFEARRLCSVRQNPALTLELTPEMGLLAHHRQIDITHPTHGPLLTLFTATTSSSAEHHKAQEDLATLLAQRLELRLVGCRVNLS